MLLNLAICDYSNKYLDKPLKNITQCTCTLINPFNIENPRIILNRESKNFNYCYFAVNGKMYYYYIVDRTIEKNNIILELQEDYLKTWESDIKASICHITRSSLGSRYIKDNLAKKLENPKIVYRNLGTALSSGVSYILIKGK